MRLNRREQILVTVLLIAAIGFLYINYLILPKYDEWTATKDTLSQRQAVLDELEALAAGNTLDVEEARLEELTSQLDEVIPTDTMLPLLYLDLLDLIEDSGVALGTINFGLPVKRDDAGHDGVFLNSMDLNLNMSGEYSSLDDFVRLVYTNDRKLTVESVSYTLGDGQVNAALTLRGYSFLKDGESYTAFTDYDFIEGKTFGKENPFDYIPADTNDDDDDDDDSDNNGDNPQTGVFGPHIVVDDPVELVSGGTVEYSRVYLKFFSNFDLVKATLNGKSVSLEYNDVMITTPGTYEVVIEDENGNTDSFVFTLIK